MRTGYKIINLKNKNIVLNGGGVTVDGIYERLESNYHKPTLLVGITVGQKEYDSRYVSFGISGSDFVADISLDGGKTVKTIKITDADVVTIVDKA